MNWTDKICGWLVALVWLVCCLFALFYVYLLLTFYIFTPKTVAENFRENRPAVVAWSLAAIAFLTGAVSVLLRRSWAQGFSLILSVLGICFGSTEILIHEPLNAPVGAVVAVVFFSIGAWLLSRSGRRYFGLAVQTA